MTVVYALLCDTVETGLTRGLSKKLMTFPPCDRFLTSFQVTKSMAGVVKSMDATLKSMNLEKVNGNFLWRYM